MDDPEKYGCVFSGFVSIPESGYYIFGCNSWGASKLWLGKQLIIDQPDTDHLSFETCIVPLDKGFYPIRSEHVLKQGQQKMELYYITPAGLAMGSGPMRIPWKALYAAKAAGN